MCLCLLACGRGAGPAGAVEKLAVIPFENLTGDAALDWVSAAAPAILSSELSGIPKIVVVAGGAVRDAYLQNATRVVRGYFENRGGKLHLEASIEDLASRKTVQHFSNDGSALTALHSFARSIDAAARPFPVEDPAVVEAWIQAIKNHSGFEDVAAKAPDFGLLYVTWAETLAAKGDREGALRVATLGLARPALKSDADRARLELLKAEIDGNDAGKVADSFDKLAKLTANDVNAVRRAAEGNFRARRYAAAITQYRAAFALEPKDPSVLNLAGYAQALNGDLEGAKATLEEYSRHLLEQAGPGQDANGRDSLGEVYFFYGKFAEAEKLFLETHQKNPALTGGYDLFKAALAHWLGGDLAGADALNQKYIEFKLKQIPGPPTVGPRELLQAQWEWMTGRADAAKKRLENRPEYAAQLILWSGDTAKLPPPFGLLAAKRFREAGEIWKKAYEQSNPSTDGLARTMYAWCLTETGRKAEAKDLLKYYAIPQQADGIFGTLVYPRFVELRK